MPYLLSVAVLLEHTLLQLLRGVEAHLLLTVIHRCNLDDNGEVTAGLYRNGQARNRDIEDGGRLAVHAETVVLLAVLPRLEVDDKLNLFGHLDRADTEDTANVNDADAAQLDKVADNLGRRTDERLVGYTLDLTASSAIRRWPRFTSSIAVSDLPTPESPSRSTPFAVDFDEIRRAA